MTPLKFDNIEEYKECSKMSYKEHHTKYFHYLKEDKNGSICVLCEKYWANDAIEQEMKVDKHAT